MAAKTKFKFELKAGADGAQFQAGEKYVELGSGDSFETDDPAVAAELDRLPFLKSSSEKPGEKAGG